MLIKKLLRLNIKYKFFRFKLNYIVMLGQLGIPIIGALIMILFLC